MALVTILANQIALPFLNFDTHFAGRTCRIAGWNRKYKERYKYWQYTTTPVALRMPKSSHRAVALRAITQTLTARHEAALLRLVLGQSDWVEDDLDLDVLSLYRAISCNRSPPRHLLYVQVSWSLPKFVSCPGD